MTKTIALMFVKDGAIIHQKHEKEPLDFVKVRERERGKACIQIWYCVCMLVEVKKRKKHHKMTEVKKRKLKAHC